MSQDTLDDGSLLEPDLPQRVEVTGMVFLSSAPLILVQKDNEGHTMLSVSIKELNAPRPFLPGVSNLALTLNCNVDSKTGSTVSLSETVVNTFIHCDASNARSLLTQEGHILALYLDTAKRLSLQYGVKTEVFDTALQAIRDHQLDTIDWDILLNTMQSIFLNVAHIQAARILQSKGISAFYTVALNRSQNMELFSLSDDPFEMMSILSRFPESDPALAGLTYDISLPWTKTSDTIGRVNFRLLQATLHPGDQVMLQKEQFEKITGIYESRRELLMKLLKKKK